MPRAHSTLRTPDGELALGDVGAVWYRRAAIGAALPDDMDRQHRAAALRESRATLLWAVVFTAALGALTSSGPCALLSSATGA